MVLELHYLQVVHARHQHTDQQHHHDNADQRATAHQ